MDGLLEPESQELPAYVVEFQMQKDKTESICHRVIMEMAAMGIQNPDRVYYGILIFANASIDPKTLPWQMMVEANVPVLRVFYLDEMLKELGRKDPNHPMLAVFQPYLEEDQDQLVKKSAGWYDSIKQSKLDEETKEKLSEIFINWLMIRFKDLPSKEVMKMLTLTTPLEETRSYKELVAIGRKEEAFKLVHKQINLKFGAIPDEFNTVLKRAPVDMLDKIAERIIVCDTMEAIFEGIK